MVFEQDETRNFDGKPLYTGRVTKGRRTRELAAELTGDRDGSSAAASRVR